LPQRGLGVAIKMDDGNNARAAEIVMAAAIESLVALTDEEAVFMRDFSRPTLRNWNRIDVGSMRPTTSLRSVLAPIASPLPLHRDLGVRPASA
jgi:L-asparaginase II